MRDQVIKLTAVISPPDSVPRRIWQCLAVNLPRTSLRPDPQFAAYLKEIITEGSTTKPQSTR